MEKAAQEKTESHVIVRLQSSNFKRLSATGVDLVPNRPTVVLRGKNEQGKSSVLDSIFAVLRGTIPDRPVRTGASKSETVIEFDTFIVSLTIPAQGSKRLTVKSKEGMPVQSPQTMLQNYSNPILLDPVGFIRQGDTVEGRRKQGKMLQELVKLDFSKLDEERSGLYTKRTDVGTKRDLAKGRLSNFPFDKDAPTIEVSATVLLQEIEEIQAKGDVVLKQVREHNSANDGVRQKRARLVDEVNQLQRQHSFTLDTVAAAEKTVKDLEKQLVQAKKNVATQTKEAASISERMKAKESELESATKDVENLNDINESEIIQRIASEKEPVAAKVNQCDEINTKVRGNKRHLEIVEEVKGYEKQYDELTARIDAIDDSKQKQLALAPFPIAGLSFDDEGILFNGLPFSEKQLSKAQLIKAACAIGFAFKPKIPVVLIRDASLLDTDSLKAVADMADANGGQVWLECVQSDDPFAIEIEAGEIKEKEDK